MGTLKRKFVPQPVPYVAHGGGRQCAWFVQGAVHRDDARYDPDRDQKYAVSPFRTRSGVLMAARWRDQGQLYQSVGQVKLSSSTGSTKAAEAVR